MEHVWRSRVHPEVVRLTARAARMRRAAAELLDEDAYGGLPASCSAPGVRSPARTREQLRQLHRDGRRIIVSGDHGSITRDGRRVELLVSSEWSENRARAAAMSRRDLVGTCRGRWRTVACGCGRRELPVGCDQTALCSWCRERHWKRWRRRIVRAMGPHLRAAVDQWARRGKRGHRPGIYLLTLTAPHSGDLEIDRKVMGRGWRAVSKAASYGGYQLGARYSLRAWWGHHALVWEATAGTANDGHLHAHVAVISQWVPYVELRRTWAAAVPGACIVDAVSPADMAARAKGRGYKSDAVGSAAFYLAKYVTKGVQPSDLPGVKAGQLLAALRNRRKVTTSRHFWRPLAARGSSCRTCGTAHVLVEAPCGLQAHAPAAVLRALVEQRTRRRLARGSPQAALPLPPG